jgi:hypothetical protein
MNTTMKTTKTTRMMMTLMAWCVPFRILFFFFASLINLKDDSDDDDLPPPRRGAGRAGGRPGRGGPPVGVNPEECKQQ